MYQGTPSGDFKDESQVYLSIDSIRSSVHPTISNPILTYPMLAIHICHMTSWPNMTGVPRAISIPLAVCGSPLPTWTIPYWKDPRIEILGQHPKVFCWTFPDQFPARPFWQIQYWWDFSRAFFGVPPTNWDVHPRMALTDKDCRNSG